MTARHARAEPPGRFTHRAAAYESTADLLAVAVPLVEQARRRGATVALIAPAVTERLLRDAVGDPGPHRLPDPPLELCRSGQSVAVHRARELRALTDRAGPLTLLVQHDPRHSPLDGPAWVELDAAINIAAALVPVTMTCLYREPADPALATAARRNHARLLGPDGSWTDNPEHRGPYEVLTDYAVPGPPPLEAADHELTFTSWQLTALRAIVAEAAQSVGLGPARTDDAVLAVNEVATNAVEHGAGVGLLSLWLAPGLLTCEVFDGGRLEQPLLGLRAPYPSDDRGRGLWLARQLCDLLHVWSDADGTRVRLRVTADGGVP